jgi:Flp pilus assembly pilin Flp
MSARAFLGRLRRDERALAATEFGLICVPFCLMIIGGLELTHQMYTTSIMNGAVNDAARRPSFGEEGDTLEERVEAAVRETVLGIDKDAVVTVTPRSFFEFSDIGNPEVLMTDHNKNGKYDEADDDCWEDANGNGQYDQDRGSEGIGGANDVVFYLVTVDTDHLFPIQAFLGGGDAYRIQMETAVRNQPYANQVEPLVLCEPVED